MRCTIIIESKVDRKKLRVRVAYVINKWNNVKSKEWQEENNIQRKKIKYTHFFYSFFWKKIVKKKKMSINIISVNKARETQIIMYHLIWCQLFVILTM